MSFFCPSSRIHFLEPPPPLLLPKKKAEYGARTFPFLLLSFPSHSLQLPQTPSPSLIKCNIGTPVPKLQATASDITKGGWGNEHLVKREMLKIPCDIPAICKDESWCQFLKGKGSGLTMEETVFYDCLEWTLPEDLEPVVELDSCPTPPKGIGRREPYWAWNKVEQELAYRQL